MSEQTETDQSRIQIRYAFISMLFALIVAQIAILATDLVRVYEPSFEFLTGVLHLVLTFCVVATSWVGWSLVEVQARIPPVTSFFKWPFLVLVVDGLLVVTYFILVSGVELTKTVAGKVQLATPDAKHESFWLICIFVGYAVWDLLVDVAIGSDGSRWRRFWALFGLPPKGSSLWCAVLAYLAWRSVGTVQHPAAVALVDLALIALVFLFRSAKPQVQVAWLIFLLIVFRLASTVSHGLG